MNSLKRNVFGQKSWNTLQGRELFVVFRKSIMDNKLSVNKNNILDLILTA